MAEEVTIEENEFMDSGMCSIEDLRSVTSMNETFDSSGYPSSSYIWRSSTMEPMSSSTTMNFSIVMSDIAGITDNQSVSPLLERRSPSIKSHHTYTGPFVLMKEYEEDTDMSFCTMNNYSTTTSQDMFVLYEITTYDEENPRKSESSATEEEEGEREENCCASDTFINRPSNSIDYSICCLPSATNVSDCGPSANARRDWPIECVSFDHLDSISVEEYLVNKHIITDQ